MVIYGDTKHTSNMTASLYTYYETFEGKADNVFPLNVNDKGIEVIGKENGSFFRYTKSKR